MPTQFQIIFCKIRNLIDNSSPMVITSMPPLMDYISSNILQSPVNYLGKKKKKKLLNHLMMQNQLTNN